MYQYTAGETDIQQRNAMKICNKDMNMCNEGMPKGYTIKMCYKDMQ